MTRPTEHTPGPWGFEAADHRPDWFVLNHSDGHGCQPEIIGGCHVEADAARIVACVNACEGIDTDALAELPDGKVAGLLDGASAALVKVRELRAERDTLAARNAELVALVRRVRNITKTHDWKEYWTKNSAIDALRMMHDETGDLLSRIGGGK